MAVLLLVRPIVRHRDRLAQSDERAGIAHPTALSVDL
jgi:hypothetical protein